MSPWTERLAVAVGWDRPRAEVGWEAVESALGTGLPGSYKAYAETFGWGEFGNCIEVFAACAEPVPGSIVGESRQRDELACLDGEFETMYAPFELFPRPGGLLIWGATQRAASFFWETTGEDPDAWPIVAVTEDDRQFTFRMEVPEFILRCITRDGVGPFALRNGTSGFTPIESYGAM